MRSRAIFLSTLLLTTVISSSQIGIAESNESAPAPTWAETAPVEELLAKIQADEAWIWDASSVFIRARGRWVKSPESVAINTEEKKKRFPNLDFNDPKVQKQIWDVLPEVNEELVLAWDDRRIAKFEDKQEISSNHRIYDGTEVRIHERYFANDQRHYALDRSPDRYLGSIMTGDLAIGRITFPDVWWMPEDQRKAKENWCPPLESFVDAGIRERDGKRFRVLTGHRGGPKYEHWIDTETGRLEYYKTLFLPNPGPEKAKRLEDEMAPFFLRALTEEIFAKNGFESDAAELLERIEGDPDWAKGFYKNHKTTLMDLFREVGDSDEEDSRITVRDALLEALVGEGVLKSDPKVLKDGLGDLSDLNPVDFQRRFEEVSKQARERIGFQHAPFVEHVFKDWREVEPGRFFPVEQGYTMWFHEVEHAGKVNFARSIHITELAVNQPLPDDLFEMEFEEGVQVNDWGHDPPLFYKHKINFASEEWNQVLNEAMEREARNKEEREKQQALIGKPAPPIQATGWLNSEPLDLNELKGKLIILDFFAQWCGPCQNDYPVLSNWRKSRNEEEVVVIGVHTPGSEEKDILEITKKFDLQYPIAVDKPPEGRGFWGNTYASYEVKGIPHAVLIDDTGIVIVHGRLSEVLNEATSRLNASSNAK